MIYSIKTCARKEIVIKVLSQLFSKGYVIFKERINNIEDFIKYQTKEGNPDCCYWNYITIGYDDECKRRLTPMDRTESVGRVGKGFKLISLEEFLKLNE